jgi:hypothetical protein
MRPRAARWLAIAGSAPPLAGLQCRLNTRYTLANVHPGLPADMRVLSRLRASI